MRFGRAIRRHFPVLAESLAILVNRSYVSDGLITRRNADFLSEPKFRSAYGKGRNTRSWGLTEPTWRVHTAIWAAMHAAKLPGDFVECGVNRGGMSLAIMDYLGFNSLNKRFFLLDTYRGFIDGAIVASANKGQYSDCYEDVLQTFKPYPQAVIIRGVVPDTLSQVDSERIAYVSLDMNCAEPEIAAFRILWPRMVTGGIVLLDDYCGGPAYKRQKDAFDEVSQEMGFRILALPTGQGMILKANA